MANKHAGEFEFEALGKKFRGHIGFRCFAIIEERTGKNFVSWLNQFVVDGRANDPSITGMALLLEAALSKHHPEVTKTLVFEIMDDAGLDGLESMLVAAVAAVQRDKKGAAANGDANPPKGESKPSTD
jgi:hypothetical protein